MATPDMLTQAVILVGGQGTRLKPLSDYLPKAMMPVLNRPFLEHAIVYLKKLGAIEVTLALSYLPESIRDYLGDGSNLGIRLNYTVEDNPLGTAGAVKHAEAYLNHTFAVLNGDIFTDLDITDMLTFHRQRKAQATIALTWVDNPSAFGIVETETNGRVSRFIEKPSPDRITTNWINAGIYILEPEILQHIPINTHYMFERGLFPRLLELGEPIYGYPFRGYWIDMGTPEKYWRLNCDLLLEKTTSPISYGFRPDRICIEEAARISPSAEITGPALIGARCRIGEKARIQGPVILGQDCRVAEEATIEEAILWPEASIGAGASLQQCILSSSTSIEQKRQLTGLVVTPDQEKSLRQPL
jgi:mannose-1-phosphate guanylyltransferase